MNTYDYRIISNLLLYINLFNKYILYRDFNVIYEKVAKKLLQKHSLQRFVKLGKLPILKFVSTIYFPSTSSAVFHCKVDETLRLRKVLGTTQEWDRCH